MGTCDCGAQCRGSICKQCLVEQNHEHLAEEVASDNVWDSEEDDDE
jgi:hypothetical protein